ncbi:MAG: PHP domain-containing protein [Crenarchaeota archaeon]|nr:PHP domain-containing protein [Thermoproteota archaeon]
MKIDLHVHTVHSDGSGTVREVIETARAKGLDGLAITDHATLKGYFEAKQYFWKMLVLPGFELSTDAGHVLVIGLEHLPPRNNLVNYEWLVEWARGEGGLTILAHPGLNTGKLGRWTNCKTDAVEVLNASYPLTFFVNRGVKIARQLGAPTVGGSDAHFPGSVGDAYTVVEADGWGFEDFSRALRNGRVAFNGRLSPLSSRVRIGFRYLALRTVFQKPF